MGFVQVENWVELRVPSGQTRGSILFSRVSDVLLPLSVTVIAFRTNQNRFCNKTLFFGDASERDCTHPGRLRKSNLK